VIAIRCIAAPYVTIARMFRPGALILLLAASAALAAPIAPADLFDDIYARSRGVEASLKTLTANFTETTTTAMLSKPVVSHGTLAVVRPDRVVLRYDEPEPHVVLIDGAKMTFSWPSRGLVQTTDIGQARKRIDRYFVDKSPAELRRSFKIAADVASDPPHTWRIVMTPTRSQISQGLSRLSLWIDRTTLLMAAMQMDFPNGDSKLMRFDHVQANGTVDPKLFSIDAVTASAPVARSYSAR
jgi:outer membrane lipoprotein-sorting protein